MTGSVDQQSAGRYGVLIAAGALFAFYFGLSLLELPERLPRHRHRCEGGDARRHGPETARVARTSGTGPSGGTPRASTTRVRHGGQTTAASRQRHHPADARSSAGPVYTLGGYRLALLLPMAGAVAAAFTPAATSPARSGPRRMDGECSGSSG